MLYNPQYERNRPRDIWSLDSLIQWLEDQEGATPYAYESSHGCMLAQYFKAMGLRNVMVTASAVYYREGIMGWFRLRQVRLLPAHFDAIAATYPSWDGRTFGNALTRAREYRAQLALAYGA